MTELWNWRIDRAAPVEVYPALAEALGRVVMPLAVADPARLPRYAVICDVWETPGSSAPSSTVTAYPSRCPSCARSPRWPGCSTGTAC